MGRKRRKEIKRHPSEEKLDELLRDAENKHRIRRLGFVKNLYQADTIAEAADREARSAATGRRWANAWNEGGLEELMPSFGAGRPPKHDEDDLTFDLKRRIERDTKEEEIEKSRRAIERRKEQGYDHGRPRFEVTYDDAGHYRVLGEDFGTVLEIFRHDRNGKSRQEIAEALEVPVGTVQNVLDRRKWYIKRGNDAEIGSVETLGE